VAGRGAHRGAFRRLGHLPSGSGARLRLPVLPAARRSRARLLAALLAALGPFVAAGCAGERAGTRSALAASAVDDFGDTVALSRAPRRIVSLNPATTEMLFALGAGARLVGRTHWDLYPDSARLVPDLGNGLQPNVEAVLATRPDLVVLYASEDNRAAAGRLRAAGVGTVALKVDSIAEFRRAVLLLGQLAGDTARARTVADSVARTLAAVRAATAGLPPVRVFWHVWDAPLLTIGAGSYLNELVEIAGGRNVYRDLPAPSPQVTLEDVIRRDPEVILAGPEGARRIQTDPAWRPLAAVRTGRVRVVDTTIVGRPSVRLGEAAVSLARVLHPGAMERHP
jgi:iron complex transport system substrate-binding protein